MTISLREAYKNIKSDAYNKNFILIFLGILLAGGILSGFADAKILNNPLTVLAYILWFLILFLSSGVYIISVHRYYKNENSIFPDIRSDLSDILSAAFKNLVGYIIVSVIIGGIIGVITFLLIKIMPVIGLIVSLILSLCAVILLSALYVCFIKTLKVGEWISFVKAYNLIKNNFKSFLNYYLKEFIIMLLAFVLFIAVLFILGLIFGVVLITNPAALKAVLTVISGIFAALIGGIGALFTVDVTGQLIKEITPDNTPVK